MMAGRLVMDPVRLEKGLVLGPRPQYRPGPIAELNNRIAVTPGHRLRYTQTWERGYLSVFDMQNFELDGTRHGQTWGNRWGILQGALDIDPINKLSGVGKEQADTVRDILFGQLAPVIRQGKELVVVVSPRSRTVDTALPFVERVKSELNIDLPIFQEPDADEISFGRQANMLKEPAKEDAKAEMDRLGLKVDTMSPEQIETFKIWNAGDALIRFPDGESILDVLVRAKKLIDKFNTDYSGKHIAFFGQGEVTIAMMVLLNSRTKIWADPATNETNIIDHRHMGLANCETRNMRYDPIN